MQRIDRRRSMGGLPTSATQPGGLQASSPRLRPSATYRDISPDGGRLKHRASSPVDRVSHTSFERSSLGGLAAAARLAAASSGDLSRQNSRLLVGSQTERLRRHSTHSPGSSALPGTGQPPPPLRHAWRFTAAALSEVPSMRSGQTSARTPLSQCREEPAAPVPIVSTSPPGDALWAQAVKCPASPVPKTERQVRGSPSALLGGPAATLERRGVEDTASYQPPPTGQFDFGPAVAAHEAAAAAPTRPRLTRARSALRTSQVPQPVRSHSADPRRRHKDRLERDREDSLEREASGLDQVLGQQEEPAAYRRVSNSGAHGGARTERHARASDGRVGDRLAELAGSSALSHSLRRPPPFKTLASTAFGGRYQAGRYLGRGASATVWEATHSDSNLRVAVKVFDQGSRDKRQATREVKVLSRVQHPNVVEAFEVIEGSLYSQLVCELVDGESLRAYAQRQPGHRLEEPMARHFYQQVVDGVSYCHDRLVVHRDLKLENLLLDRSGERVKIIDFGFATQVASRDAKLRAFCGTPSYMAPEIVRGDGYSGFATDVWALGVVVFALLAGSLPFIGRTEMQLYSKIRRGTFSVPDMFGDGPRRLVRATLRLEPSSRPSAGAILRQSWVSGHSDGSRTKREGNVEPDRSVLRSPILGGHHRSGGFPAPTTAGGGENDSSWIMNSPGRGSPKHTLEPRSDIQATFGKDKDHHRRRSSMGDRPESPSLGRRPVLGDPRRSRASLPGAGVAGTALGGS